MSGTSLDGLDIAACRFWEDNNQWKFEIIKAQTFEYTSIEKDALKMAFHLTGMDLIKLHHHYGSLIGEKVNLFCQNHNIKPDYIASHGHTIFHQPNNKTNFFSPSQDLNAFTRQAQFLSESQLTPQRNQHNNLQFSIQNLQLNGFTFQLGHGANIAAKSGIKTICDFRTSDVAYGGQGAPLVPIGDELLFAAFDYCLNLGGISNISFNEDGVRKAFDIGICNMALNELAQQLNLEYDKDGLVAQSGSIDNILLTQLQNSAKENQQKHQSLGYEWYLSFIKPIINQSNISTANKMRTFCEFIACQISEAITSNNKILATGGGAKNKFLMQCLQAKTNGEIIIPNNELIDFKEALIFAFLGMLRVNEQPNSLSNVTGALKDVSGGCIYLP